MSRTKSALTMALGCWLASTPTIAMDKLSNEQMSEAYGQGNVNFTFENIEFAGTAVPGEAEAGSINVEAVDGSSLGLKQFQFSAANIGTRASPLTAGTVTVDGTVNEAVLPGQTVIVTDNSLGEQEYLRIGFPDKAAWNDVDLGFQALFGNPDVVDLENPNIAAGGTPSSRLNFGHVSVDNLAVTGHLDVRGIPEGYKIKSQKVDDGTSGLGGLFTSSRQGLLLNVNLEEVSIDELLFEPGEGDGGFTADRDLVIRDFSLQNLQLTSATIETTTEGWRIAYSDPQPFILSLGAVGEIAAPGVAGNPDTANPAFDPDFPKASLSFEAQMTHGQASTSRLQGVTLDHLVFNVDGQ